MLQPFRPALPLRTIIHCLHITVTSSTYSVHTLLQGIKTLHWVHWVRTVTSCGDECWSLPEKSALSPSQIWQIKSHSISLCLQFELEEVNVVLNFWRKNIFCHISVDWRGHHSLTGGRKSWRCEIGGNMLDDGEEKHSANTLQCRRQNFWWPFHLYQHQLVQQATPHRTLCLMLSSPYFT